MDRTILTTREMPPGHPDGHEKKNARLLAESGVFPDAGVPTRSWSYPHFTRFHALPSPEEPQGSLSVDQVGDVRPFVTQSLNN
jgi:hypothetical protein